MPANPHLPGERDDTQPVTVASLPWEEAHLMAGRLRAEGIPATVYPPDYVGYYGKAYQQSFDVLVPEQEVERARATVRAVVEGDG